VINVYVIEGLANRRRYVGITNDLNRRLAEHSNGTSHSGRLLGPFRLLHTETFPDYPSARAREKYLKSGQGREWLARHLA
jgi:putative endonuclease